MRQQTLCQLPVRPLHAHAKIVQLGQAHLSGQGLACSGKLYRPSRKSFTVLSASYDDKTLTAFAVESPGETPSQPISYTPVTLCSTLHKVLLASDQKGPSPSFQIIKRHMCDADQSDEVLECSTVRDRLEPRYWHRAQQSLISAILHFMQRCPRGLIA